MSKLAEKTAEKAAEKAKEVSLEQVFGLLEQKVEGLSARMRELLAENAKLKGAAAEAAAERDRARKELEALGAASESQAKTAEKLAALEAEREEVRARIERLLTGLEQAEDGTAGA